jgi:fructan beta-fructosidase
VGDFNGKVFTNEGKSPEARWVDYGKDNYAGVTWSGIPEADGRRIFLGWMSNWQYAGIVPSTVWRGATTLPRELKLVKLSDEEYALKGYPTSEFENYGGKWETLQKQLQKYPGGASASFPLGKADAFDYSVELDMSASKLATIQLSNSKNEMFDIILDKTNQQCLINRKQSGKTAFSADFPSDIKAPYTIKDKVQLRLVIDQSSVELFMDGGLLEMTNIVYPEEIYNHVTIKSDQEITVINSEVRKLTSIWR